MGRTFLSAAHFCFSLFCNLRFCHINYSIFGMLPVVCIAHFGNASGVSA